MQTVCIQATKKYDVVIGAGLLDEVGVRTAKLLSPCKAMLVADDVVDLHYGWRVKTSLQNAGFAVTRFVFPHGEGSKNLQTYGRLQEALLAAGFTRGDVVLALGGGVTGDLAGFAAATYQRGMGLVQLPTTLLAMVDSSVGGKTAVDLPGGKNQVGCFYQPLLVICDTDTLGTLPPQQLACGFAEEIKCGVLQGEPLFSQLEQRPGQAQTEQRIADCVELKRRYVQEDEFDRGSRMLLNLGHTVGHAIEVCGGFRLLHGQAVAVGLAVMLRAAEKKGYCSRATRERGIALLEKYGLPTQTGFSAQALAAAALEDKKRLGDTVTLIVPRRIGCCEPVKIPVAQLRDWIEAGSEG